MALFTLNTLLLIIILKYVSLTNTISRFHTNKVNNNFINYLNFASVLVAHLIKQTHWYCEWKNYKSNFCDMLPLVAANRFNTRIFKCSSAIHVTHKYQSHNSRQYSIQCTPHYNLFFQ